MLSFYSNPLHTLYSNSTILLLKYFTDALTSHIQNGLPVLDDAEAHIACSKNHAVRALRKNML